MFVSRIKSALGKLLGRRSTTLDPVSATSGIIAVDQTSFEIGQRFSVRELQLTPPWPQDETRAITDLTALNGSVLLLAALVDGRSHIVGSACLIAPGLALTATHVIDDCRDRGFLEHPTFALYANGVRSDGIQFWRVATIEIVPHSDMTILLLQYASDIKQQSKFEVLKITARLPTVGERITAVGFRPTTDEGRIEQQDRRFHAEGCYIVGTGRILDVYPQGRDRMMPQPCFSAEVNTIGSMSGGPVLNAQGMMIGLLTSSIAGNEEYRGVSFFTALIDALVNQTKPIWPPTYWPDDKRCLFEILPVHEGWRFSMSPDGDKWSYQASGDTLDPSSHVWDA